MSDNASRWKLRRWRRYRNYNFWLGERQWLQGASHGDLRGNARNSSYVHNDVSFDVASRSRMHCKRHGWNKSIPDANRHHDDRTDNDNAYNQTDVRRRSRGNADGRISVELLELMKMIPKLCFLLALAGLAGPAQAGPRNWLSHHKRFVAMESAALTGAAIHYAGLNHCRKRNGPEPCDAHYGAAWQAYWFTTGLTVVALPATAEGCWRDQQGKFCNLFAYTGSASQAGWGVHEWRVKAKHER